MTETEVSGRKYNGDDSVERRAYSGRKGEGFCV